MGKHMGCNSGSIIGETIKLLSIYIPNQNGRCIPNINSLVALAIILKKTMCTVLIRKASVKYGRRYSNPTPRYQQV